MLRFRVVTLILFVAVLVMNNMHLPLFQVAAWSGMLVSYSKAYSISEAIEMTFDGENPCSMCKSIRQAQEATSENTTPDGLQGSTTRDICGLPAVARSMFHPSSSFRSFLASLEQDPQELNYPPPSPPPIRA